MSQGQTENFFKAAVDRLGLVTPSWVMDAGITLDPHQLMARHESLRDRRKIIGMDKGLGKTFTALTTYDDLQFRTAGFTNVIFTTEKGMGAYERDIRKLYPQRSPGSDFGDILQVVAGNKNQRSVAWRNNHARHFVCTYDGFLSDVGLRSSTDASGQRQFSDSIVPDWVRSNQIDAVVWDEFHRKFRRHQSKTFASFKSLFRDTKFVMPLSGSPMSSGPKDLWPVLHLLDQKFWSSYWKYVYTWHHIDEGGFGRTIGDVRADRAPKWQQAVKPYFFLCTKEMVGNSMVEKRRGFLDVKLPAWQKKLHDQLRDQLMAVINTGATGDNDAIPQEGQEANGNEEYIIGGNKLAALHMLRTALICPRVLNPELGVGQGIEDIWEDAAESELRQYAIFTPFRAPIPILEAYLQQRGARVFTLMGGIGKQRHESTLDSFRHSLNGATGDRPSIVLYTIKYGESWEIPECSYGYGLGYEYDPEDNKQAEDRLHRKISPIPVSIQYTRSPGTYDDDLINLLITKVGNRELSFKSWGQIRRVLK